MLIAVFACGAQAMEYSVEPMLQLQGVYDDNIHFTSSDVRSVSGYLTSPSVQLDARDETTSVGLGLGATFHRYNRNEYDTDDQNAQFDLQQNWEYHRLAFRAQAVKDSTLTSEFLDSGRVGDLTRHKMTVLQPSWTYIVGERNSIGLQGSYSRQRYDSTSFTDYDYWLASLRWTHVWSERTNLIVEGYHTDYESEEVQARRTIFGAPFYRSVIKSDGVQLGGDHTFSERLKVTALAGRGWEKTEQDVRNGRLVCSGLGVLLPVCQEPEKKSLTTADINLTWVTERHELIAGVSRKSSPSSEGYTLETDHYTVDWNYQVWERGKLATNITIGSHQSQGSAASTANSRQSERDFRYGSITYRHTLSESLSLSCTYQYQYQKYELAEDSAVSQAAYLGITYQPRGWRWSR